MVHSPLREKIKNKKCRLNFLSDIFLFFLFLLKKIFLPSHSQTKKSISLTVVGEEGSDVTIVGAHRQSGKVAQARDGVFTRFNKVNADNTLECSPPLLSRFE